MEIRKMEEFLAVVEAGQITAAADALYMSQSSLSKKMSALSKELGCELFTKTKTGIKLTPTGWEFYAYARRAVREFHQVQDRINSMKNGSKGILNVGSLPLALEYGIEDAVSTYWAEHPLIEINYHERNQDNLITDLNLHKLDVAIARIDRLDDQQYVHASLFDDEMVIVCHRSHPLASKREVPLASLRNEHFVLLAERSDITKGFLERCEAAGFYPNSPTHSTRHRMALKAVSHRMGITALPRRLAEAQNDSELVIVPLTETIMTKIGFVWLRRYGTNPLIDDFILEVGKSLGIIGRWKLDSFSRQTGD